MHRTLIRALLAPAVATLAIAAVAPVASSQKLATKSYVDSQNGYEVNPPDKWDIVPVQPNMTELGVLARIESDELFLDLLIVRAPLDPEGQPIGFLKRLGFFYGDEVMKRTTSLEDEIVEIAKLQVHHQQVRVDDLHNANILFDVWAFPLKNATIELVYSIDADDKKAKRWLQTFQRSAKSFEVVEIEALAKPDEHSSYDSILAFHAEEAARTPGWRALPTPSKKYVIKTSSDNQRFLDEVIERLELSRELYERDFPPQVAMDVVSVVRVCATEEEFHRYGQTGGGVAGWYNPGTKELVLYDGKNIDRNMSYAVMSHEAFHQYCHFLFDQSEAHRWFDEGHGDYYGGAEFDRGRAKITPRMPAGLDRLSIIRDMMTQGTYKPIPEHINYSHPEWQSQGPSNVSCYAQSWSLVYFLREGTLGNVSRKVWKDEYAQIIPTYSKTLFEGFQEAYEEARKERMEKAEKDGGTVVLERERPPLGEAKKQEIWKKAIEASWGPIDFEQFEADWVLYVKKYLE